MDLNEIEKKDRCRNVALKRLSNMLRTEKDIRDYLKKKEFDDNLIEDTISFLKEYSYINDRYYARSYYITENQKMKGKSRIIMELKKKGLKDSDISLGIEDSLGEEDTRIKSDLELARELYLKIKRDELNLGRELNDKFKAKAIRRLISKGFKYDDIFKVINEKYDE